MKDEVLDTTSPEKNAVQRFVSAVKTYAGNALVLATCATLIALCVRYLWLTAFPATWERDAAAHTFTSNLGFGAKFWMVVFAAALFLACVRLLRRAAAFVKSYHIFAIYGMIMGFVGLLDMLALLRAGSTGEIREGILKLIRDLL